MLNQTEMIVQINLLGYQPNETIFLRAIKTGKNGGCQKIKCQLNKIPESRLQELQNHGYNLYLVVNGQGNTDAEIKSGRAIFYEHDNLSKDIQQKLWQHLNLPEPTFQVDTGGKSIHSYWVLDRAIPINQWKELQADLLEYADADRSIKNPSRVMRLAGTVHQGTHLQSLIISSIGHRYSFEELRANVPITATSGSANDVTDVTVTPTAAASTATSTAASNGASTQKSATAFCIPLENCLTKEHRDFLASGVSEGGRNNSGAALARDLIGTANRLDYLGIEYSGNPRQLLDEFASRCVPPLPTREVDAIWKSALQKPVTACLTDDALVNCVKAFEYHQTRSYSTVSKSPVASDGGDIGGGNGNGSSSLPPNLSPEERDEVFRLEVLAYSDEANPFKKLRLKGQICSKYRISFKELQGLVDSPIPASSE